MRTIKVYCDIYGNTTVQDNKMLVLSNANEEVTIEVTFQDDTYTSYRKRVDILVDKDGSTDYIEQDIAKVLTFELTREYTKQGKITLQPIAYQYELGVDYLDSPTQKWKPIKLDVQYSINASESTTNVDSPLGFVLEQDIETIKLDMLDKMNLNGDNSNVDVLSFNTSTLQALSKVGQVRWNDAERTLEVRLSNDVTLQIGKETLLRATNKDSTTILNGNACYVIGGAGANVYTKLATNTDELVAQSTIGVATEDLTVNENGYICTEGIVGGINTNAFTEGDILYLGTNGNLINVEPTAPTPKIFIGVVLRKGITNGSVYVKIRAVPMLSRLSDVYINNLQNNDVLKWNSTSMRWENKPL